MPFHPTCFEIFKHASRLHFNNIDITGLMGYRRLESSDGDWDDFPRDPAVRKGQEQWWSHKPGDAYLAANPVLVPGLAAILRAAVHEEPSFDARGGAFEASVRYEALTAAAAANDPFERLPQELNYEILTHLHSRDISNLRLASRAFRQLPISLFYTLLRHEMPWLWEVHSPHPPSFWATTSVPELKAAQVARKEYEDRLRLNREALRQEMPEILEEWMEAQEPYRDLNAERTRTRAEEASVELPWGKTNWYELYRNFTVQWKQLKGLHNRRRIWKDVEEIISRIGRYRDEGKIVD